MVTQKLSTWISLHAGATVFAVVVVGFIGLGTGHFWLSGLACILLGVVAVLLGRGRYVTTPVVSGLPSVIVGGPSAIESVADITDRTAPISTYSMPNKSELRDPALRIDRE